MSEPMTDKEFAEQTLRMFSSKPARQKWNWTGYLFVLLLLVLLLCQPIFKLFHV